jgi:hypothetical protein
VCSLVHLFVARSIISTPPHSRPASAAFKIKIKARRFQYRYMDGVLWNLCIIYWGALFVGCRTSYVPWAMWWCGGEWRVIVRACRAELAAIAVVGASGRGFHAPFLCRVP